MSVVEQDIVQAVRSIAEYIDKYDNDEGILAEIYLSLYTMGRTRFPKGRGERGQWAPIDRAYVRHVLDQLRTSGVVNGFRYTPSRWASAFVFEDERRGPSRSRGEASGENEEELVVKLFEAPGFISVQYDGGFTGAWSRIYLALKPCDSYWFFGHLGSSLFAEKVSGGMKVLSQPKSFVRADAGVLYVYPNSLERAIEIVRKKICDEGICLNPITPLGTANVDTGIAWADSIATDGKLLNPVSYGQWLSRLMHDAARECGRKFSNAELCAFIEKKGRLLNHIYCRKDRIVDLGKV